MIERPPGRSIPKGRLVDGTQCGVAQQFCVCAKQIKWRSHGRRGQIACASPPRTELVAGRDVNSADLDATPKKQIVKNDFPGELDCRWLLLPSQTVTSGGVVFPGQPRPP